MLVDPAMVSDDNPQGLTFLPIDPFGAKPHEASRIPGLGGPHPADDPNYAFRSVQLHPALGQACLTLKFHGLTATAGVLIVRLQALSVYPGTAPMTVKSVTIDLKDLVHQDGVLEMRFQSRRNMMYTIGGTIEGDTDVQAQLIALSLTPRHREPLLGTAVATPHAIEPAIPPLASEPTVVQITQQRQRPELIAVQPPVFARPVSQAMTAAQVRDPLVSRWNDTLGQPSDDATVAWENAFILQVLAYYGVGTAGVAALGITCVDDPLPSYLAGRGNAVLAVVPRREDWPQGDPGLALERMHVPALCTAPQFFSSVNFAQFENLAVAPGLVGFDFLWSRGTERGIADRTAFPQMLCDSMLSVKPGGTVVHLLRYSGTIARAPEDARLLASKPDSMPISYSRAEIERMALSLIAAGHEVAQLKFTVDTAPATATGERSIPFALVARRAR